jgi:hypothetical protein
MMKENECGILFYLQIKIKLTLKDNIIAIFVEADEFVKNLDKKLKNT